MIDLKKILPPKLRYRIMNMLWFLPDSLYIRLFYFTTTGQKLNLKHPTGYNEKLNWLKLNDKHPEYAKLVDKLAVREHIKQVLGEEYLFPLYGYWKSFDEIDFDALPNEFVLKCNHDSGSVKIIRDKSSLTQLDKKELKKFYEHRLSHDFFYAGREYPYKGLPRYIIAEQFMKDENGAVSIEDYKFFCFNGEPKIMFVATDRAIDCKFDFFDMEFRHLPITNIHPNAGEKIQKPALFDEMKEIATRLSKGMKQVRIDLYEIGGKIYFGEYTFFHGGGTVLFQPDEWEQTLGSWIDLEN